MSAGPDPLAPGRTLFRLWAPDCETVGLEIAGLAPQPMERGPHGWFTAEAPCGAGAAYRYRVKPDLAVPDPASRRQAGDVHDASVVTDPDAYRWRHGDWRGRPWHEAVIYELHVGLCGGFAGAMARLPALADLGVTAIELMPVGDFPGARNWGYDGVLPYAPDAAYGTPDELKALVDAAHGLGLTVLLDVVYNHFGPDGNYLGRYASPFWRRDAATPWGDAFDFRRDEVQRFFIDNAAYWLREFRFDGLRLDAVQAIVPPDFLPVLAREVRAAAGPSRHVHLVMEHEANAASLLRGSPGAPGYDAQWADDWHHCLHVLLTGETEGYYGAFAHDPAGLLARCLAEGFAYQGQISPHTGAPRGEPSAHLPPSCFVICLQNHDQIGNRALGERLAALAEPDALRAATALLLLTPQIPLLFMGQEWGTRTPFLYFTDHRGELAEAVRQGRRREFEHFAAFRDPAQRARIPDPNDPATFEASRPDPAEATQPGHAEWLALHRHLLALRTRHIAPHAANARAVGAAVLNPRAVRAAWRLGNGITLSVAANFSDRDIPLALEGAVIYATPGATGAMLPPNGFVATIAPAP